MIKKYSQFINESNTDEISLINRELSESLTDYVQEDEYGKKFIKLENSRGEITKMVDEVQKEIGEKMLPKFKVLNLGKWSDFNKGYGGVRMSWKRRFQDENGKNLELTFGWGSSHQYGSNQLPYPISLSSHCYGEVHFHHGSIAVGGGSSSTEFTELSYEKKGEISTEVVRLMADRIKSALKR